MIPHHIHYFTRHLDREVKEVYFFAGINSLAIALTYIFEPIYLFQLGYSLPWIMWFYVQVYAWYSVVMFFAAIVAGKIGYKHSIFISSLMYIAYWLTLYNIKDMPELFFVAPFLFALQKSFFWPAYNADVAMGSKKQQRGREVGVLLSVIEVCAIVGPFLGGLISSTLGFNALFISSSTLLILAVYPLFKSPDIYEDHKFEFKNFKEIFNKYPSNFWGYWGYAEDLMLTNLWPLFIFLTIPYFLGVGIVATFAGLSAAMLMLYIGRLVDTANKMAWIKKASIAYGFTWVFRFLAIGVPFVLIFDVMTKTLKALINVPMLSLTYDLAGGKSANHAIAYAVFYEFSLSIAKIFMSLAAIIILGLTGNIYLVFVLAGVLTMFYSLLKE